MIGWVLAAGAVALLWPRACFVIAFKAWENGQWRKAARWAVRGQMHLPRHARFYGLMYELSALREQGDLPAMVNRAREALQEPEILPSARNAIVEAFISAGAYSEALRARDAPPVETNHANTANLAVLQINLAEAEYNLGDWDSAERRMLSLAVGATSHPIVRAGHAVQLAWIAAHRGRPEAAMRLLDEADVAGLPANYRAEFHFTRAAACLAADRFAEADAALARAAAVIRRSSSARNLLFLRARLAAARGEYADADALCRAAAAHPHKGQGGDGLLLWAQVLKKLGDDEKANAALRLAIERDPESSAAAEARSALSAS